MYQSGVAVAGATLTGYYSYSDAENDLQGTSIFKWYRADDDAGLNETAISGANGRTYTVTTADNSKYLRFGVTPVAQTGATPGSEVKAPAFLVSSEGCTVLSVPSPGSQSPATNQITWNWNAVPGATGYKWSAVDDYTTATDMGPVTTKTEDGLSCNTGYTRYVWAYSGCGNSVLATLAQSTGSVPSSPVPGIHTVAAGQLTWTWSAVPGATGYKWNTTDDYTSATDLGNVTSKTDTGIIYYNIYYNRYVWAYNACGGSGVTILTQTATTWTCGLHLLVTHSMSGVAPVTKTTSYATVNNIPGNSNKCWITSNLGSDHQATYKNDLTDASAGWFWQFNRKQGYKTDGTMLTPAWTIDTISENSDWLVSHDPCNLLLGTGWHIPTMTEWMSLFNTTGSWSDPWNSALKMHCPGYLHSENGYHTTSGNIGSYWSSTEDNSNYGTMLRIEKNVGYIYSSGFKASGFSVRCVRDF